MSREQEHASFLGKTKDDLEYSPVVRLQPWRVSVLTLRLCVKGFATALLSSHKATKIRKCRTRIGEAIFCGAVHGRDVRATCVSNAGCALFRSYLRFLKASF